MSKKTNTALSSPTPIGDPDAVPAKAGNYTGTGFPLSV
ncbi:MAG: hypothetical protein UT11_C0031G0004 [Berkelbacteria bacterium GW2011_GWA2_38_9]|uniref:Uncharacterized protein n=1 Tax=Berkelbacteria bacterium GW2011_GWA2_38_9 TaxID=1618334 RepID=A0A0G0PIU6_9BACT|nr:MAG: hypothetical protein UT11_C0031G0004 [Berkelbacteria bacterium GW2011_GWA2_38_9]